MSYEKEIMRIAQYYGFWEDITYSRTGDTHKLVFDNGDPLCMQMTFEGDESYVWRGMYEAIIEYGVYRIINKEAKWINQCK